MPLLSYVVRLVLLILVPPSSLLCYLYDAVLILTSDILYSLIDTFLSILEIHRVLVLWDNPILISVYVFYGCIIKAFDICG
jgi:hypothetical protein